LTRIPGSLKLRQHLFSHFKLCPDVPYNVVALACEHLGCVPEEPVQAPETIGVPLGAIPSLLNHLKESMAFKPEALELEVFPSGEGGIFLQEVGSMI
jgi:hypothetical protein